MGYPRYLLFKSTVGRIAPRVSYRLRRICNLGPLVFAPAADVRTLLRAFSRGRYVVDIHLSFAQSPLAAGSGGNATRVYRWRPGAYHRRP